MDVIALKLPDGLREDLPPSTKLVLLILQEAEQPLTLDAIATRTALPKETVRRRCRELVEHDLVSKHPSLSDARRVRFKATQTAPPPPDSG
ncbi:MarR family transcriptional regulator [Halobaculum sp. CBA1158]|uniref:MarR family transcriptional regulator n=1 Tax=Halobaculum sp. CBA1158 TaxID=2904243 RepID=UPI001F3683DD|nr:helix-turn-helix domain-containing protein [Halobaculum sp. CBA1158]UIO98882.1 MarR family transcriptional regulator [Halobaculum sp. CBA1158]